MSHQGLGEFEQIVLLAILHMDGEVYGVPIVEEMERKRLLSSWMSEPTPERGGKPRRCVKVEPEGLRLLRESRRLMNDMWEGIDAALADMP